MHVPSFRRRRVATPSVSAPASASTLAPTSIPLFVEDGEVFLHDADVRPYMRKVVDVEEGVPTAIDLIEDELVVRETAMIHIREDVGVTYEVP